MKNEQVDHRWNHFPETHFGRTVDDILESGFFNSLDTNIRESIKHYHLEIAVPGMTRKDLAIDVRSGVLQVRGQRRAASRFGWGRANMEFSSRSVQRSYILPPDANARRITARCRHGLLHIMIPKTPRKDFRYLDIELAAGSLPRRYNRPWYSIVADRFRELFSARPHR